MASVNFFLKDSNNKKRKSILYMQISFKSDNGFEKFKVSTEMKLYPSEWNQSKQKSKYPEINDFLLKLEKKVNTIITKAKSLNLQLSKEYIKENLVKKENNEEVPLPMGFNSALKEYLEVEKAVRTNGTMKQKTSSLKHVLTFIGNHHQNFTFDSIDLRFYDRFIEYCYGEAKLHTGATGNAIKNLKAFLNWAYDRGYHRNLNFKKKAFKKPKSETDIIYLTKTELFQLYDAEMPTKKLEVVRDAFCFGCFTGLRFSDISQLTKSNLVEKEVTIDGISQKLLFLEIRVKKTKNLISQPMNKYAKSIIQKNESDRNSCFKMYSEQKTNEYLKLVAEQAELIRIVKKTKYRGAEAVTKEAPLHKVITFHMSKKTFMTNFLAQGGSLQTAMSFTGNKDYATAKRYFTIVDDLKAAEMIKVFND